jgi:hypothetical protein
VTDDYPACDYEVAGVNIASHHHLKTQGTVVSEPAQPTLTIHDFTSENMKIYDVPVSASQTFQGQKLIRQVVPPIPYSGAHKRIHRRTIEEFNLTKRE